MSSKNKTTATSGEVKPALVPKLRFPEFRRAEPWQVSRFDEVLSPVVRERSKPAVAYMGLGLRSHGKGTFLKPLADPAKNSMDQLYEVKADDLIVNITFAWEGAVAIARKCDEGALVSHRFPTYTFEKGRTTPQFFRYIILDKQFVYSLGVISPGGAGRNRVLNKNDFLKLLVSLPRPAEQQKIAACLISVDELIAAQVRKVDALKTHKKGLMQQIFPREGETQPCFRFPEFQNAAEWVSSSLGAIFETTSGGTPSRTEKAYWNGNIPWITTSLVCFQMITSAEEFITAAGLANSSAKLLPKSTVLMAMYGQGKTRGQVALLGIEAATNQACAAILPRKGIDPYFVFTNLAGRYDEIRGMSNSGGQENLSQGLIREIRFAFPPDDAEQRKVTSCLSSLDALITAETQKLEAFKTRKQGLMQQLFPSPEEVEA